MPKRDELRPLPTVSILQIASGLSEFRRYARFVEDSVDSFYAERYLKSKGLEIVYLVDFQEIYSYLAPFLLHPTERRPHLDRFLASKQLFESSEERLCLPIGTLAEVAAFVQRLKNRVQSLYQVTLAQDLDRAVDNFLSFFKAERFLASEGFDSWLGATEPMGPEGRLVKMQLEALFLLSDFESGVSRLHNLLSSKNLFDLSSLLINYRVRVDDKSYRDIHRELVDIRKGGRHHDDSSLSNVADAFNTSLAISLNDRFGLDVSVPQDRKPPWYFFKVLTDTRSLFTLKNRLDAQLTYRNYHGVDLTLFERCDEVLYKRNLYRLAAGQKLGSVQDVANKARLAKDALARLDDLSMGKGIASDVILRNVFDSSSFDDLSLLSSLKEVIADIQSFIRTDRSISESQIEERVREEAASFGRLKSSAKERPYAAQSVLSLKNTLESIESILGSIERMGFELTPVQRKTSPKVWNPVVSLENMGLRERLVEVSSSVTSAQGFYAFWEVVRKSDGRAVLRVDIYSEFVAIYWDTASDLDVVISSLKNLLVGQVEEDGEVQVVVIGYEGSERNFNCKFWKLDSSSFDLVGGVSFIRFDFSDWSLTAELFSSDEGLPLKTGLIVPLPARHADISNAVNAFCMLGLYYVPEELLREAMVRVLSTYLIAGSRKSVFQRLIGG